MIDPARVAQRMQHIQPFHVMSLLARAHALHAAGREVVHMEIGEPDFASPAPVIEAGTLALAQGRTHYTPAAGLPALREAIAGWYEHTFGLSVDPARIIVTPGASGALLLALAATLDPGQEVLLSDPGYPANRHFVRLLDAVPVGVAVGAQDRYQLHAAKVREHWGPATRAVMLASPSNPTGTTLDPPEIAEILAFARERGGLVVVDEIYQGLVYDGAPASALALGEDLIVINSFSKYFHMTGWRLGWLVVPPRLADAVERLAQNVFLSPSAPAQYAALAALAPQTRALLEQRRAAFVERRDYLLPALRDLGFAIPVTPRGAFYIYADCAGLAADSFRFAAELLEREAVAVAPGLDFGEHRAGRHLRFAYTTGLEHLRLGVERIARFLGR